MKLWRQQKCLSLGAFLSLRFDRAAFLKHDGACVYDPCRERGIFHDGLLMAALAHPTIGPLKPEANKKILVRVHGRQRIA